MFRKKECGVCGRKYSKEEELMNHVQSSHGGAEYDCRRCGMYFSSMEEMRAHLQKSHSYGG